MIDQEHRAFSSVLWALRDYLPEIVIVGGWAPHLYFRYLFPQQGVAPLKTRDIDIVVSERLPVLGGMTINALLGSMGFTASLSSHYPQPVVIYEGRVEGEPVQLEFLTHPKGKRQDIAITVQEGLNAQALRYINILYEQSEAIVIDDFLVDGKPVLLPVRVPTPAAYLYHKGLILPLRGAGKEAKDLYYMFDLLAIDYPNYQAVLASNIGEIAAMYPRNWLRSFKSNLTSYFRDSRGADLAAGQRPEWAFPGMNDAQFRQYVDAVFNSFIRHL